jgi:hypothetical protein
VLAREARAALAIAAKRSVQAQPRRVKSLTRSLLNKAQPRKPRDRAPTGFPRGPGVRIEEGEAGCQGVNPARAA